MVSTKKEFTLLNLNKSNKFHEIFILFSILFFGAWGGSTLSRFPIKFHEFVAGPIGTFMIIVFNLIILDDFKVSIRSFIEILFQAVIYTVLLQLVITYFNYQTLIEQQAKEEATKQEIKEEIINELRNN